MDFRILGSLEVWDGERQLELGGPKRRAVLALLLLHANEVVAVDRLVDELWGEKAPRNATAALHTHVSRLRKELGSEIIARRAWGYVLRAEPGTVDLERFERLVSEAENLPARERAEKLGEALALWRGPPLEDLAFEPALEGDIARLDALHLTVLENRIDADLEAGNHAGLVGELEALIAQHPLRERLRGQLILALYRSGRQAEALEVYRETRRLLAEELGLEPSPELRELERAILQQDPALRANVASTDLAEVVAETGVRPGRRRRILLGAFLALLLAGGGAAAAYALSTHTTQTIDVGNTSLTTTQIVSTTAPPTTGEDNRGNGSGGSGTTSKGGNQGGGGSTSSTTQTKSGNGSTTSMQTVTTVSHPRQRPITILDTFAGGLVRPSIWTPATLDGGDVSLVQQGGTLQLTVRSDAAATGGHPIDVQVTTQCYFPKGFDARVTYKLLEWPAGDNIEVGMSANSDSAGVMRDYSSESGDEYASWIGTQSYSPPFPIMGGSLRIRRFKNTETTYYWHKAGWQKLVTAKQVGPTDINLQAFSDGNPFGGVEVKVAFDNFKVTGVDPVCPRHTPRPRA
jgi:DNA-binding SARP family transcriptional activator